MDYTKTIYKLDSKNKLRSYTVEAEDGELRQISGLYDGKKTTRSKFCKPKNLGKANETTEIEQAVKEAKAKIVDKLAIKSENGVMLGEYFETIDDAKTHTIISPMLANDYFKFKHKVNYPVIVQPKLDGQRCIVIKNNNGVTLMSRDYKQLDIPGIKTEMERSIYPNGIYDGELYVHGLTFQEVIKLVKNQHKSIDAVRNIQYYIYDIVSDEPYQSRMEALPVAGYVESQSQVKYLGYTIINSENELHSIYSKIFNAGYEGIMLRDIAAPYEMGKRSNALLKYKMFIDIVCELEDVTPNDSDPTCGTPHLIYTHTEGQFKGTTVRFKAGCKLSHEERQELLVNRAQYIGSSAEIRFFEFTDEGVPRFPVFHGMRSDKNINYEIRYCI